MTARDAAAQQRAMLSQALQQQMLAALRNVLRTYAHHLQDHDLSPEALWLLLHVQGGPRPRGELLVELDQSIAQPEAAVEDLTNAGYLNAGDDGSLSLSERACDVVAQIQRLAQPANERWRKDAAAAADQPQRLPELLAMLQARTGE